MKTDFRFGLLVFPMLMIFLFTGCSGTNSGTKYNADVRLVREGYLHMNPNVPIGKAFDQFFINDSWKSFTSTENEKIVEFKGDCSFDNEPATVKVQFEILGNEFIVHYVGLNNVPLNDLDGLGILEKVLSEYRP